MANTGPTQLAKLRYVWNLKQEVWKQGQVINIYGVSSIQGII